MPAARTIQQERRVSPRHCSRSWTSSNGFSRATLPGSHGSPCEPALVRNLTPRGNKSQCSPEYTDCLDKPTGFGLDPLAVTLKTGLFRVAIQDGQSRYIAPSEQESFRFR